MPRPRKTPPQPELLALPPVAKVRKKRSDAKPVRVKKEPVIQVAFAWDAPGLIAGVDEAGRGPLAGNVVAAAVILDDLNPIKGLNDSKKLTALRREKLYEDIIAKALCVSVGEASVEEIDRLNILQATMLAMQRAVNGLRLKPAKVLVDGNRIPKLDVLAEAIVGGDAKVQAISAASNVMRFMRNIRNTALMPTKATAQPSTWQHSRNTAQRRSIARAMRPWRKRLQGMPYDQPTQRYHFARQSARQRAAPACARWRGVS
jgi:ribonuclease HII